MPDPDPRLDAFARLLAVVDRLRAPDGCPWDRAQTLPSMAPHVLEEAHEVVEALRRFDARGTSEAKDEETELCKEAGDLLMNVVLLARIAEDEARFDLGAIADRTADKLVRRHPHVFGAAEAGDAGQALRSWEDVKREERAALGEHADRSVLSGIPRGLPALLRAQRTGEKCAAVGFEWPDLAGPFAKAREELEELAEAAAAPESEERAQQLAHELGDLLFSVVNLARHLGVDAEMTLRQCVDRFERRFRFVEKELGARLSEAGLAEMDALWDEAKRRESGGPLSDSRRNSDSQR